MAIVLVPDPLDSRLGDYRNLSDAELARNRGIFIAEGRLVVSRLLVSTRLATRSVMVTEAALPAVTELTGRSASAPIYVVPQAVMNEITGFNIHRGCLAVGVRPATESLEQTTAGAQVVVVLERVANADNVGGIFRNAAAFGVDAVLLDDVTTDPLYRKAIRTSMGAALEVPFTRAVPLDRALADLRNRGFTTIALTPSANAQPLQAIAREMAGRAVALVAGHEGEGLTASTRALCDRQARIAMHGDVDSLNVATATAIALYELSRQ